MITKWKVSNFKSIREETELNFGRLTIFAGANSSGKSTIVQSILLIAQTLSNKLNSRSVVLNGALTTLGQFDDLKSNGSDSDQITIKCTCSPPPDMTISQLLEKSRFFPYSYRPLNLQEIACEISFGSDPSNSKKEIFQVQPQLFASRLICTSRDYDDKERRAKISILRSKKKLSDRGIDPRIELSDRFSAGLVYRVELDEASMAEMKEKLPFSAYTIGCDLRHFLPELVICGIDIVKEDAKTITNILQEIPQGDDIHRGYTSIRRGYTSIRRHLRAASTSDDLLGGVPLSEEIVSVLRDILEGIDFDFDEAFMTPRVWSERLKFLPPDVRTKIQETLQQRNNLFERILEAMQKSYPQSSKLHYRVSEPPEQIVAATSYLDDFFTSSLKYLGPLRDVPKPLYPLAPTVDPNDVGLRGENTAAILDLHKNKEISYIPSDHFKTPAINRDIVTKTLGTAVTDWLQYLGVASSLKSQDQGKLGHKLQVGLGSSEALHDLTHVGVGVSQVLPILVMSLLADSDSTLIFEQPELHLHPKVQTLLSDFFISMALCNKQCIVETHSEYLIDRLRFWIATAPFEDEINNQAKIYFVEKSSQGSLFREVMINEYGAILDWPEGFFDQSHQQSEEILRAAALKRKRKREKL